MRKRNVRMMVVTTRLCWLRMRHITYLSLPGCRDVVKKISKYSSQSREYPPLLESKSTYICTDMSTLNKVPDDNLSLTRGCCTLYIQRARKRREREKGGKIKTEVLNLRPQLGSNYIGNEHFLTLSRFSLQLFFQCVLLEESPRVLWD